MLPPFSVHAICSAVSLDVGASTYPATCSPEWRTQVLVFSLMLQMARWRGRLAGGSAQFNLNPRTLP
jgi:hypothetical protein